MRIALAQLNFHVGNLEYNAAKIIETIQQAETKNTDLVVFPELAICGYPPRDFLEYDYFIKECIGTINDIAQHCIKTGAIIGGPSINPNTKGKNLYNSAFFLYQGKVQQLIHKALLPTYDVFDEYRYFEPASHFEVIDFKNRKIALTICEDIWDVDSDLMYNVSPLEELKRKNPDLLINIAASPFNYSHDHNRRHVLKQNVEKYKLPLFYVNQVGAQTELIFDGGSMVMSETADLIYHAPFFKEDLSYFDLEISKDDVRNYYVRSLQPLLDTDESNLAKIYQALITGIRDYFKKAGFKQAILGLSGGVDSALVAVLAAHALGKENVWAVLLPSQYSSDHSVSDSLKLATQLGIKNSTIEIEGVFGSLEHALKPEFKDLPFNIAEENLQSRSRGVLLMALSNKFGHVLLNTTNKSEMAVGYGTLYGDMCGGISVIGDLYKTQVYELCNYINQHFGNPIPENILTKAPSAELRPGQKDSDSLPEYNVLDKILFEYIELKKGRKDITDLGYEDALVEKVLKLVNASEYKRFQAPPVLRVSPKAFGMGRRMPLEGKYKV